MSDVLILGRGKVGRGLYDALVEAGADATLRSARRPRSADLAAADCVVLAVPDAAIVETVARVAERTREGTPLVHCAGNQPADVARDAAHGRPLGAMHPLVSFADARHAPSLVGTTFTLSGDASARRAARALVRALGARALEQPLQGPAYHAAAALVANGATALAALGIELLVSLDVTPRAASRAMGALLRTVGENVEALGLPKALTGPVARGDVSTVRAHRAALKPHRRVLAAYDAIAPAILDVAQAAGLSASRARALRRVLAQK